MVPQFPVQPFYHAANLTVDTNHAQRKYLEEEDKDVLEDIILDRSAVDSGLELSPPMVSSRRELFAVSSTLFSPKTEDWHSVDMQSVPSNNPFVDQQSSTSNNPFMRLDQNQQHVFGQQQAGGWLMSSGSGNGSTSGSATPFQTFDQMPADEYDCGASMFRGQMQSQAAFDSGSSFFSPLGTGDQAIPTSPSKEWMVAAQAVNKKGSPGSPAVRSHNGLRRGDGIRKKNARFEIPAERNLGNIDHLISQTTDEQEIKELKQQKRLLRNRQAALDSRQRKKRHTERLEDEKKQFTALVSEMEEDINSLKDRVEQLIREQQSYTDYIETLTFEKEEMIRSHTIETGELRKKIGILSNHVKRLEGNSMGPAHVNPTLTEAYDETCDMAMAGAWDGTGFLNDYPVEAPVKQQLAVVPARKAESMGLADGDGGASQGGLLFMLFLVGAFVMSSRSTPAIPRVSDDVRAASATILDNVFKEAGVGSQPHMMGPVIPQPSGSSWAQATGSGPPAGIAVAPSMLEELGNSLTQPTEEQRNEQMFSLSAAQYNGVNNQDFVQESTPQATSHGRRNLAEAVASMRTANKQIGAADVYTRSLLWDQIPAKSCEILPRWLRNATMHKTSSNAKK